MFGITPFAGAPFGATSDTAIVPTPGTWGYGTWGSDPWGGFTGTVVALTGVGAAGTVGALTPNNVGAVIGDEATGSAGTTGVSHTNAVTGVFADGAVGTVSDKGISIGITGVAADGSAGTLTSSRTVNLTGTTASGLLGAFALSNTNAVTGVFSDGAVGTVSDKGISIGITGNAAIGATETVSPSAQVGILGVEAGGAAGYLPVPLSPLTAEGNVGSVEFGFGFDLTSTAAQASVGSVSVGNRTLALTGVSAAGSVGTIVPVYWQLIDNSETANWININSTQTPGWSTIEDSQAAGWVLIDSAT